MQQLQGKTEETDKSLKFGKGRKRGLMDAMMWAHREGAKEGSMEGGRAFPSVRPSAPLLDIHGTARPLMDLLCYGQRQSVLYSSANMGRRKKRREEGRREKKK